MARSITSTTAVDNIPLLIPTIAAAIVFGLLGCYHVYLCFKQKTWYLWWFIAATFMETSSYSLRAYYARNPYPSEERKFMISYLLIILAPFIFFVSLLKTFSRLTWYTTPPHKRSFATTWVPQGSFKRKILKLAYIAGFTLAFFGSGGVISSHSSPNSTTASSPESLTLSEHLLKAAFAIQLLYTIAFIIVLSHYVFVSKVFTPSALLTQDVPPRSWRMLTYTLMIASGLILLRTIYRMFEISDSSPDVRDYLQSHEWVFWVGDAIPMLLVVAGFVSVHPGTCLPVVYTKFWFRTGKVKKMEKKVLETQSWTGQSSVGDVECGSVDYAGVEKPEFGVQSHEQSSRMYHNVTMPTQAHLPARN